MAQSEFRCIEWGLVLNAALNTAKNLFTFDNVVFGRTSINSPKLATPLGELSINTLRLTTSYKPKILVVNS